MDLTQKFTTKTQAPLRGGEAGIWLSRYAQEVVDALASGSGAGVPDSTGTPTAGVIVPGQIVELNSDGNFDLATQCDLSSATGKLYFVVFSGDRDFSGAFVGKLNACHGGMRFVTEKYDSGTYAPGDALVVSSGTAGNLMKKASASDHIQVVGVVGPDGVSAVDGTLDVIMTQGIQGA